MAQEARPTMAREPKQRQQDRVEQSRQVRADGGRNNGILEYNCSQTEGDDKENDWNKDY